MQSIRGPKNVAAGLIFLGLAALFGWSALELDMGTARRMGPGYFPMLMVGLLVVFGVGVLADGLLRRSDAPEGASLRAILLVSAAVVVFALSVRSLGLVPAVALTSFLFSLASRDFRLVPSLATALVLAGFSWVVFVEALSLPWPAFGTLLR